MTESGTKSDGELYESFLRGETNSYDQLMIRYGNRLVCYLYGYLRDWEESEDMMVEAFARIMVKRPRMRDDAFRAYPYRTARNLALRFLERKRSVTIFSTDGMDREIAEYVISAGSGRMMGGSDDSVSAPDSRPVEEELRAREQRQLLHECLGRIKPELREALWLFYFEDMSYAQAASVMGVKEKRIDHLLSRGKQQMRRELEKEGVTSAHE